MAGDALVLLLPERRRLAAAALDADLRQRFGRADRLADGAPGEAAQLQRHFTIEPAGWPLAALTRELESGDAGTGTWLRADPGFMRAEVGGARLMACGDLGFAPGEADELLEPLRSMFDEAGLPVSAGAEGRWYLRLEPAAPGIVERLPDFAAPAEALGADVLPFLPVGREFAKWRSLFNEAQVLLHHHPRNAARIASGLPPVNALWFWGGGALPERVVGAASAVWSGDFELRALARRAGMEVEPEIAPPGPALLDFRRDRDWVRIGEALRASASAIVDFADGVRYALRPSQRWRVWRRAMDPGA